MWVGLLALMGSLLPISGAQALSLPPPSSGPVAFSGADNQAVLGAGGTVVATLPGLYTGVDVANATVFTGTYDSWVIRETSGTLTFAYQIHNAGPNAPHRVTVSNYGNIFTADAFYDPNAVPPGTLVGSTPGTLAPVSADRDQGVIGFNFGSPFITTGTSTDIFYVRTNATDYGFGNMSVIDGGTANVLVFAPVAPEPGSIVLAMIGISGLGMFGWQSLVRRKETPEMA